MGRFAIRTTRLDPFSFLETTTEVSVAVTGFLALFLVLARRDGSFEPFVALGIRVVLLSSVASLLYAATPLLLAGLGLEGERLWRIAAVVPLLSGVVLTVAVRRISRRLPGFQPPTYVQVARLMNGAAILLFVFNLLGWPWSPYAGVHLLGVWLVLGLSAVNFVGLVLQRVLGDPAD